MVYKGEYKDYLYVKPDDSPDSLRLFTGYSIIYRKKTKFSAALPNFVYMDLQSILVFILFSLAIFSLGRMIYRSMTSKKACASNCGKCGADFSEVKIPGSEK